MPRVPCATPYCTNKKPKSGSICYKCKNRKYREKHPMESSYQVLKDNAKRRGHEFTITFSYFKKFCYKTNYIAGKGRTKESYSIDRIKNELGYVPGNLQVMSVSHNSVKGAKKMLVYDWETGSGFVVKSITPPLMITTIHFR